MICELCGDHAERKESVHGFGMWICSTGCCFKMSQRIKPPPTPELEKAKSVEFQAGAITQFLDWLLDQGINSIERLYQYPDVREQTVAEFLGIDLDKIEKEKEVYMDWLREMKSRPSPNQCAEPNCNSDRREGSSYCGPHKHLANK